MDGKPRGIWRIAFRLPVYLYRCKLGWLLGHRFLLLIHVGRRTGSRHQTVLEVLEYRKASLEAIVMSGFGRQSDWFRNIEARPDDVAVVIGSHRFKARYRLLSDAEAVQVFRGYEKRNAVVMPVVRRVLSRLLGWKYSGSDADLLRAVGQLPLVAFCPDRISAPAP